MRLLILVTSAFLALSAAGGVDEGLARATYAGDNGRIAISGAFDGFQIATMDPDGSDKIQITNVDNGFERSPDWSPDGSRIVFASERDSDPDQVREIYVMNADGSDQTRLTFNGSFAAGPSWSPDGSTIAFNTNRDGDTEIYAMNPDGTDVRDLTNSHSTGEYDPSWSPDGSQFVYEQDGDIYIRNSDGSNPRAVTTGKEADQFPDWSPDGDMIAFERTPAGGDERVYIAKTDGSGLTQISDGSAPDHDPVWSPDGTQIAFAREINPAVYEIFVMNVDGTKAVNISNTPDVNEDSPNWLAIRTPGDADCDHDVDSVDALQVERRVAALSAHACVYRGNVKCTDDLNAVDALQILRFVAALPLNLPAGCPEIAA
jgi:Tol biopolymer transport system component